MASTGAFSVAVTAPHVDPSACPDDVDARAHHNKGSKSFRNPWPSFKDAKLIQVLPEIIWYAFFQIAQ